MTRCLAFIKLNASLLIFHRFKKRLGLTFAHLPLLFRFGLGSLHIFVWRFCRFVSASSFQFASEFPLRRFLRRGGRSEEHTSELQSHSDLVCRLLLEKKKRKP